ncbi:MAG: type II toxin-antitoxin system Phd/YefM family antitoxin [Candidatus Latescibacteria bacterium]|nr:type II toxin-antitoxin system Phd/YefM family antitoxin [Candidatus Latescibacterota bacterium]
MRIASIAQIKARFSAYIKESQSGPVIVTCNGKPAAVLLNIVDEDELEGLLLAYSPKFQALLRTARQEIQATGGIPHDEFWQQVDAEYAKAPASPKRRAGTAGKVRRRPAAPLKKARAKKTAMAAVK